MSKDGTEAGAYSDNPSVVEVSVSEPVSGMDTTCLHVSEVRAGPAGCHVDQVGQCPDQHPIPRANSVRTHRLL